MKIKKIVEISEQFFSVGAPAFCWSDNKSQTSNHWSGTKEEMENFFRRQLSPEEVTVLSISRCWGPTPSLKEEEAIEILNFLWPEGNAAGQRLKWDDLSQKLLELKAI
jgi:hypothetical protein